MSAVGYHCACEVGYKCAPGSPCGLGILYARECIATEAPTGSPTDAPSPTRSPTLSPSSALTASPTYSPTAAPTGVGGMETTPVPSKQANQEPWSERPTTTPTVAPTSHPCDDGSHGCAALEHGTCVAESSPQMYHCACDQGFKCWPEGSCDPGKNDPHTCVATCPPSRSPTTASSLALAPTSSPSPKAIAKAAKTRVEKEGSHEAAGTGAAGSSESHAVAVGEAAFKAKLAARGASAEAGARAAGAATNAWAREQGVSELDAARVAAYTSALIYMREAAGGRNPDILDTAYVAVDVMVEALQGRHMDFVAEVSGDVAAVASLASMDVPGAAPGAVVARPPESLVETAQANTTEYFAQLAAYSGIAHMHGAHASDDDAVRVACDAATAVAVVVMKAPREKSGQCAEAVADPTLPPSDTAKPDAALWRLAEAAGAYAASAAVLATKSEQVVLRSFDCSVASLARWQYKWSTTKAEYCCTVEGSGCQTDKSQRMER